MRRALALLAGVVVVTGTGPADAVPTLPVVTQKLPTDATSCPNLSGTPLAGVPWAQEYLGLDALADRSTGAGVRIGLVDTGFDGSGDPGLAGRVRVLPPVHAKAAVSKKPASKSTAPTSPTAPDCVGHGTAMASLIAAPAGTEPGVHGLAPDASVVSVQATDDAGNPTADDLATGIDAVVAAGARIVAVGTGTIRTSDALDAALVAANRKGVLVVAPARYDAQSDDGVLYPAASDGVLSVSDVGPGGLPPQDTPTGSPVDLAAPGDRVVALGHAGRGQVTGSGPSYAVAYVAAAAARVLAYRPTLSGAQLAERLVRTAAPPPGHTADPQLGRGVLDVRAALDTEFGQGGHAIAPVAPPVRAARAAHTGLPVALGVAGGAGAVVLIAAGAAFSVLARRRRFAD